MEIYITVIKDILVIATPIIVAIISYRSSKKTERDIRLELEKSLKEKDADTSQIETFCVKSVRPEIFPYRI